MIEENSYENVKRLIFSNEEHGDAYFIPVCEKCGRFVKVPPQLAFDGYGQPLKNQLECSKCGITNMIFEGYY